MPLHSLSARLLALVLFALQAGCATPEIDVSVALDCGGGASPAVTADIDTYALERGLFGGIALDGSALRIRPDLHAAWYGKAVTLDDIVARRIASSPDAGRLAAAVEALEP